MHIGRENRHPSRIMRPEWNNCPFCGHDLTEEKKNYTELKKTLKRLASMELINPAQIDKILSDY